MSNPNEIDRSRRQFLRHSAALAAYAIVKNEPTLTQLPMTPDEYPNWLINIIENAARMPYFEFSGFPNTVQGRALRGAETVKGIEIGKAASGDVKHENTIGLGTEYWLAEPGVRTFIYPGVGADGRWNDNQFNIDIYQWQKGVAYPFIPGVVCVPTTGNPENFPPEEGGFMLATLKFGRIMMGDSLNGLMTVTLGLPPNVNPETHAWFALIRGWRRDNITPKDKNMPITIIDNYMPSWTQLVRLPPGQYVSETHLIDNVLSAHKKRSCGADGCPHVSIAFIDANTGAHLIISANDNNPSNWEKIETNIA